jgi:hypothetical protein
MSYEAVRWALYDAPMLLTAAGKPDTAARFVLLARAERADKHGRNTYAGPADLMRTTGYDERTIQRADRRLEDAGLLVREGFSHVGTVRWRVDMSLKQPAVEPVVDARIEKRRKADAARQQRLRERRKAESSAPESGQPIEPDVSNKVTVTHSESVTSRISNPDVTDSVSGCHGRSAPQTTLRTTHRTALGTAPGGAPPPDPRRPHSPSAPGTGEQKSPNGPLTPAQDQQSESLPHANARGPDAGQAGSVVDFFTREAM